MNINEAFETIQREVKMATEFLAKANSMKESLDKRENEVMTMEKHLKLRIADYEISPEESNRRYEQAIDLQESLEKKEKELNEKEVSVKEDEINALKLLDDAQARMKDIEVEKASIQARELSLIEREKDMREKIKKELLEGLK